MTRPPNLQDLIARRFSRRDFLRGSGAVMALGALSYTAPALAKAALHSTTSLTFTPIPKVRDAMHHLAAGYQLSVLIAWGEPILPDAGAGTLPATGKEQERRFGYNNDYLAYFPLPKGSDNSTHGLLHVNHEYTNGELMFTGVRRATAAVDVSNEQMRIEMAAQGGSVLEVKRDDGGWQVVPGSRYHRRITVNTPMSVSGPAAGHRRMRTSTDPTGRTVFGTFANCAGGVTPWGTVLMSEENVDQHFYGHTSGPEAFNHRRYTIGAKPYYGWHRIAPRFNPESEPNEPNRFGWVVEYDPYDPESVPVKRTALGRFKHEAATVTQTADGRVVVYSGDDSWFEYLYRYVSREPVRNDNRDTVLDDGVLSVAKLEADGSLRWIPLVHGQPGLTAEHGFHSQADVLIETRRAGDMVGATPMDRPEGIAVHPNGSVFVSLTKNPVRAAGGEGNPRPGNKAGHIVELRAPGGDHGTERFSWDLFLLAGDPKRTASTAYGPQATDWLACPDNLAVDPSGNLWVATDSVELFGSADGLFAMPVTGPDRAAPKAFFYGPRGSEPTGPCFTPDGKTLFLSIQHPGEGSSRDEPSTRWPDFDPALPPRPAVVAIVKDDGGVIGG